jgi:uncharacterized membrane protein (UPF0127 family)
MRKLIGLVLLLTLMSCQSESRKPIDPPRPIKEVQLVTPSGETIETTLAITLLEQEQGLSGVKPEDFSDEQGLLFFYLQDDERHFWMPDTYFDLDLIYLDKELKITDIIRKLPHHKGRANQELIPRARGVWARHVLEMKSSSEIAKKLKEGDVLQWKGKKSLIETENQIRERQCLK